MACTANLFGKSVALMGVDLRKRSSLATVSEQTSEPLSWAVVMALPLAVLPGAAPAL